MTKTKKRRPTRADTERIASENIPLRVLTPARLHAPRNRPQSLALSKIAELAGLRRVLRGSRSLVLIDGELWG